MDTYTCIYNCTYNNGRHGRKSSSPIMTHVAIHPHGTCTNETSISLPFQASKPLPSSNSYRRYLATFPFDLPKVPPIRPYILSVSTPLSASSPLSITSPFIPGIHLLHPILPVPFHLPAISVRQLTSLSPHFPLFPVTDKTRQKKRRPEIEARKWIDNTQ